MKALLAITLALSLCTAASAQPRPAKADEAGVRAVIAREIDGWSKFSSDEVASTYTEDVTWQNPFGVRIHGRAQVKRFLDNLFARPGYRSATDTDPAKIIEIHFPSPTVAIVWSDESSKGQIDDKTGKPMQPRHSIYLEVVVKRNGTWQISELLIMDVLHLP